MKTNNEDVRKIHRKITSTTDYEPNKPEIKKEKQPDKFSEFLKKTFSRNKSRIVKMEI